MKRLNYQSPLILILMIATILCSSCKADAKSTEGTSEIPAPSSPSDPDEEGTDEEVIIDAESLADFTDEFDSEQVDTSIWDVNTYSWGTWSWRTDNAYIEDGIFKIKMQYEPHIRDNNQLYFTSAIIRSNKEVTYGYFEAKIKGCDLEKGACPAFWLFSEIDLADAQVCNGTTVTYSEVDIVEMQQGNWSDELWGFTPINQLDFNINLRIIDDNDEDGDGDTTEEIWIRPNVYTYLSSDWTAPWDPRDDYHTYGAEITSEYIVWYVDRVEVARKDNIYCHIPMRRKYPR